MAKLVSARWGLGLLGLAVIAALLPALGQRFFGRSRLRFTYFTGQQSDAAYRELSQKPGWAPSKIEVAPNVRLRGLIRRPSSADAPWVLFYSGNDPSMLATGQRFLTRLAESRDWGLGVYAYRGFDSSDGKAELASLAADAPIIAQRLRAAEKVPAGKLHLVGFSIGGHMAVHAARRLVALGERARTLSLLASVNDIVMLPNVPWQRLSAGDDYQTNPLLGEVPAPVLVAQGTADEAFGGAQQGRDIAKALGARAKYLELEGVGHQGLLESEPALAAVRELIESAK